MGFLDWLMHGLGFEEKEGTKEGKKENKKGKAEVTTEDKYANFNLHERVEGETNNADVMPSATTINSFGMQSASNIIMVEPKTYKEMQKVVDYLKQGQSVAVNLEGIDSDDRARILDFLSGALYGLNGSIHRWHGDLFLVTPEGHKILKPEN